MSRIGGVERRKLEQQPEDVNASPLASEDEDEDGGGMPSASFLKLKPSVPVKQTPLEQSDDSESETPGRGDMKKVNFSGPNSDKIRRNAGRDVKQKEYKRSPTEDTDDNSSSSAKRRRLSDNSGSGSANQFRTAEGFARKHKTQAKYGSRSGVSQAARGSQSSQGSQKSQTKKGQPKKFDREAVFQKTQDDLLNSSQTQERPAFKKVLREFLSPTKPSNKLKSVPKDDYGTPEKKTRKSIVLPECEPPSPSKGTKGQAQRLSQDNEPSEGPSSSQQRSKIWDMTRAQRQKEKKTKERLPQLERATFVLPIDIDADLGVDDAGSISSPVLSGLEQLSDIESDNDTLLKDEETLQDKTAPCPWCGESVSEQALKEFSKGKRLNVQMQTRFCAKHKKETAMETWRERGYPHIEWDRLEERLDGHRAFLTRIVDGKQSHFRDILAEKVETGQARSLKKEGNLNPGYYGPRGCKLMCDYLVEEFGESLKEKATKDRVISGRGSAAFIQSVLVAELAVQLIMEDMHVCATEARGIMEESKTLGELIHEEV
ncbi:hypothetical protein FHETE_9292 [Fusarium heterosporum]|uniref:Restriction of telomere capping protein 4 n=1 Tax=Fusarium heterosporum TaxID=42747 RepID=A0A8H5STL7_FUSHE|nr:hypothetical protein FHETE_9292 [Fusarium heterosporum]